MARYNRFRHSCEINANLQAKRERIEDANERQLLVEIARDIARQDGPPDLPLPASSTSYHVTTTRKTATGWIREVTLEPADPNAPRGVSVEVVILPLPLGVTALRLTQVTCERWKDRALKAEAALAAKEIA